MQEHHLSLMYTEQDAGDPVLGQRAEPEALARLVGRPSLDPNDSRLGSCYGSHTTVMVLSLSVTAGEHLHCGYNNL